MVNSLSLLSLSNVKSVPKSRPTGKAFPKILGSSYVKISMAVFMPYSPARVLLIVFKSISGAIHTTVKSKIDTNAAKNTCVKIYLS